MGKVTQKGRLVGTTIKVKVPAINTPKYSRRFASPWGKGEGGTGDALTRGLEPSEEGDKKTNVRKGRPPRGNSRAPSHPGEGSRNQGRPLKKKKGTGIAPEVSVKDLGSKPLMPHSGGKNERGGRN